MFYVRKSNFSTDRRNREKRVRANHPADNHQKKTFFAFHISHFSTQAYTAMPIYQIVLHFRKFGCVEVDVAQNMTEYKMWCSTSTLIFSERRNSFVMTYEANQTTTSNQPTHTHTNEDTPTQVVWIMKNMFVQWRVRCVCELMAKVL